MRIRGSVLRKIVSVLSSALLLLNSFTPYLLLAPSFINQVKAEEPTITQTQEPFDSFDETQDKSAQGEPTVTPTPVVDVTSTVEVTPTVEVTLVPTVAPTELPTITPTEKVSVPSPPEGDIDTYVAPNVDAASVNTDAIDPENVIETAKLATDKADYAPTDTAIITGTGFTPNETYILKIYSTDDPPTATEVEVTTDADGQFVYAYQLDGIYRPDYTVVAKDTSGEVIAETTFTDTAHVTTSSTLNSINTPITVGQTGVAFSGNVSASPAVPNGAPVVLQYSTQSNFPGGQTTDIVTVLTSGSNGSFNGSFTAPSAGTYYFRVRFANYNVPGPSGGTTWDSIDSSSQTITVNAAKNTPTITFKTAPTPTYLGGNFTVSATTTNTDSSVLTYSGVSGPCAFIGGSIFSSSGAGTCVVRASGAETTNFYSASNTQSVTIAKATPTLSVTNSPQDYDGSAQVATVDGSVGGIVSNVRYDGSTTVPTDAGTYAVTANFLPTDTTNYNSLIGASAGSFIINKVDSVTSVTCPVSEVYTGSALTPCTVSVTGANLIFTSDPDYAANINVGTATASYTFAGDANHTGSDDSTTFEITKADSSTVVTCPANAPYTGSVVIPCSVSVTGAGGLSLTPTPVYKDNIVVGTATASYDFAGDANHKISSDSKTFEIVKAKSSVTVICPAEGQKYTGSAIEPCTASYSTDDGLSGSLTSTYSDNTNVGTATANATYDGDANHESSSNSKTFEIVKAPSTTTVTFEIGPYIYRGSAITATAKVTGAGGLDESVEIVYSGDCTNVTIDGCTATATFAGDANHDGSTDAKNIAIAKANSTTVLAFESGPYVYRGTPFTATAAVTGVGGLSQPVTVVYSGDCTNVTSVNGCTATATYSGDSNHEGSTDIKHITITKADAICTINGYTGIYNAASHGATGSCTGVKDEILSGLTLGDSFTNVPGGTANWSFTGGTNYKDQNGSVEIEISKADPTIVVTPYDVIYNGEAHTATYTAKGVKGEDLAGIDVSDTTHTDAGFYKDDSWTFTDVTGNYNDKSGKVDDNIDKANATIVVTPYDVTYDGDAHTATGTAEGVESTPIDLSSLLHLDGTTHTNAGDYKTDAWTFDGNENYNSDSGTVNDKIAKADPTIDITPYDVTYDGNPHTATGTATGVKSESLSGLVLSGTTHTNAGDYPTDAWTFTDVTGNYNNDSGIVNDKIAKADAICAIFGWTGKYDTTAHGASGSCLGVKGEILEGLDLGTSFTNVSGGIAHWSFTGGTNYINESGDVNIVIEPREALVNYIGQTNFVTSGTSSTTAQVTLTASMQDPTGNYGLSGATVDFIDFNTKKVLASGVKVSPVAGALDTGTANTILTLSTGQYGSQSYLILVKASGNYNNEDQDITDKTAIVVISKPASTNQTIGGGTVAGASAGTYRSSAAATFSVGMVYNKSGTNPQGKITLIIPQTDDSIVYINSNSISSMAVTVTSPKNATIYTKATAYRVANGVSQTIDGNITLRMDVVYNASLPSPSSQVGFTVLSSKTSQLYYSNNWVLSTSKNAWITVPSASSGLVTVN